MADETHLYDALRDVASGQVSVSQAIASLQPQTPVVHGVVVDDAREGRTGVAEVVFGEGKTADQIIAVFEHFHSRSTPALATRVPETVANLVSQAIEGCTYEIAPRLLWNSFETPVFSTRWPERVAVISGGSSDEPVAEEAARCAEWMGLSVERHFDIGVAGLHRLLSRLPQLSLARVIIAVAGMEGALPGVVAGLVKAPVIAVPTSVGYGANLGGLTTMLSMSNACSGGVAVMNIDNGFGAAMYARRIVAGGKR